MKTTTRAVSLLSAIALAQAAPVDERDVDTTYPYTGPAIPIGDWVDPTINGNGKGFPRLVEPPAVAPASANPSNNINVISLAYLPGGINIHYQTPFGLGEDSSVNWGTSATNLDSTKTGQTHTYNRTPPCSLVSVTQCSQYFHEVQIKDLEPDTTYYYQIPAANGTTASDVLSFTTARAAGDSTEFTVAILNDMGYTNAMGTYAQLMQGIEDGIAFAWHGGDLSYADDWYSGILPCEDDWPVCYNGSSTELPGPAPVPDYYKTPLPEGEVADQGGPQGGDMSVLYESNWDLWQNWMTNITSQIPYMVMPGNHEATCSEFDGPGNILTAYLNDDESNSTASKSALTYYSCPPSQRNFTAYQQRFRMPGDEVGGVTNFWYSFDYGLAHFVTIDGETDFADSPEYPFARDLKDGQTHPTEAETYITDSGPFGSVGDYYDTTTYEQYQWLANDLSNVDRTKTPWVIAMSHRPMYSSQVSSYQKHLRSAFQDLLLENGVDAYISGHIHWYERLWPLTSDGEIDSDSIIDDNTYYTNPGTSMTHIINGMAGNIESHSTLDSGEEPANITAVLDFTHYGFSKLRVINSTAITFTFIEGGDGSEGDQLTLLKQPSSDDSDSSSVDKATSTTSKRSYHFTNGTVPTSSGSSYTTKVVTEYTTYCPAPTVFTQGSSTYTVTQATTLTITDCPCTLTMPAPTNGTGSLTSATSKVHTFTPAEETSSPVVVPGGPLHSATSSPAGGSPGTTTEIVPPVVTYTPTETSASTAPSSSSTVATSDAIRADSASLLSLAGVLALAVWLL